MKRLVIGTAAIVAVSCGWNQDSIDTRQQLPNAQTSKSSQEAEMDDVPTFVVNSDGSVEMNESAKADLAANGVDSSDASAVMALVMSNGVNPAGQPDPNACAPDVVTTTPYKKGDKTCTKTKTTNYTRRNQEKSIACTITQKNNGAPGCVQSKEQPRGSTTNPWVTAVCIYDYTIDGTGGAPSCEFPPRSKDGKQQGNPNCNSFDKSGQINPIPTGKTYKTDDFTTNQAVCEFQNTQGTSGIPNPCPPVVADETKNLPYSCSYCWPSKITEVETCEEPCPEDPNATAMGLKGVCVSTTRPVTPSSSTIIPSTTRPFSPPSTTRYTVPMPTTIQTR